MSGIGTNGPLAPDRSTKLSPLGSSWAVSRLRVRGDTHRDRLELRQRELPGELEAGRVNEEDDGVGDDQRGLVVKQVEVSDVAELGPIEAGDSAEPALAERRALLLTSATRLRR